MHTRNAYAHKNDSSYINDTCRFELASRIFYRFNFCVQNLNGYGCLSKAPYYVFSM